MCACVFMLARSDTGAGQPRSVDHDTHGRCLGQVSIDRVDGIEVGFGLLRGVQIYEPNEVRIKTSRSEDHKRQKPDITRKKIVEACVYDDGKKKKARSKGVNLKVR